MVAELHSIVDPAERTRFALGAIAAIARLSLSGLSSAPAPAPAPLVAVREEDGMPSGGSPMSNLTSGQLLRRHARPFAVSLLSLTALLVAQHAVRLVPQLSAGGASASSILGVLLLVIPFTLALTIPMATFIAVSWVFTRLGREGILGAARRERHGVRRLLAPVLGAAAVIATLTFVSNAQVVPRTNTRLAAELAGVPPRLTDRTMTIGELRAAAENARSAPTPEAAVRASGFEVEIQKKIALAMACMVLALTAAAIAIRFPDGGGRLVSGASVIVFTAYYFSLVAGESLADRGMVSPFVAMWLPNLVLLTAVLLLLWRPARPGPAHAAERLAIGG